MCPRAYLRRQGLPPASASHFEALALDGRALPRRGALPIQELPSGCMPHRSNFRGVLFQQFKTSSLPQFPGKLDTTEAESVNNR
mmetsp:Transcript_75514/g.149285  ORF Transcript_75514/g.149285 Transcript_75514/m.149285 type:complete len:84 (+) Transcript_75514:61-312(+)